MGLDGFSMGNLGLHKEVTSAQMANQAEQLATRGSEFKIRDISNIGDKKGIERKKEGSGNNQETFKDGFLNKQGEEENPFLEQMAQEDFEKADPKEFSVRVNPRTEMVELYNNQSNKIIETISAEDLMGLLSKLDSASGILVNKKI